MIFLLPALVTRPLASRSIPLIITVAGAVAVHQGRWEEAEGKKVEVSLLDPPDNYCLKPIYVWIYTTPSHPD
jgi:hypothetical protein